MKSGKIQYKDMNVYFSRKGWENYMMTEGGSDSAGEGGSQLDETFSSSKFWRP